MNECETIAAHVAGCIEAAAQGSEPFHHLLLKDVFPPAIYEALLQAMPVSRAYRPMSGRARMRGADGVHTRTKLHLLPESIRRVPPAQRSIWGSVGTALPSRVVREALVRRLAPGLASRFGADYASTGMYAIPMLTRDVPGYRIGIHPDTRHKAITVQLYLPRDESISHVGTAFHRRLADGSFDKVLKMPFMPNTGYAFAVAADTFHSVDRLGDEVATRDSILLTYFVDDTLWQVVQNRAKRFGNLARELLR